MAHLIKIGVTCAMGAPTGSPFPINTEDFVSTVDWLADHNFDSMEVHIRAPELVDAPRLYDRCCKRGIEISTIGTGMAYGMEGLCITSASTTIRSAAVQRLKAQLDLGTIFHCPVIIGSMRGTIGETETFRSVDARMQESMKELAEHAEKVNGELVIEALNRFETNYLCTAEDVLSLIDRVGSSRVKVHLDSFHMNLEEKNWRDPILKCGKQLGHFHVADNSRKYPGWGLVNFHAIISALLEIKYNRSLTMECYPYPDGQTAALKGLQFLNAVMENFNTNCIA